MSLMSTIPCEAESDLLRLRWRKQCIGLTRDKDDLVGRDGRREERRRRRRVRARDGTLGRAASLKGGNLDHKERLSVRRREV